MRRAPAHAARFVALCLASLPGHAFAEGWSCGFTRECAVATGCVNAAFTARVTPTARADAAILATAMGEGRIVALTPAGSLPASYAGAGQIGTAELLTIEADRSAVLSVHLFDDTALTLTYFGTCAELP